MKISSKSVLILAMTVLVSLLALSGSSYAAPNGLVAHYKFNGDFNDSSGNNNNGSVVAAVSLAEDSVVGKCAVFNGGYINVPSSPALNLGSNFTISVWVLVDSAKAGNRVLPILSKMDDKGQYNVYHAYARGSFAARMDTRLVKSGDYLVTGGPYDNYAMNNSWTHLLFSGDGERMYLYVNGTLRGSSRDFKGGDSIPPSNGKMRIGTGNNANNQNLFFLGKMADLRLYNRALNVGEIQALYNAGANAE